MLNEQDKKLMIDEIFEGYWLASQMLNPKENLELLGAIAAEAVSLAAHAADVDWKIADEEGVSYDEWHNAAEVDDE